MKKVFIAMLAIVIVILSFSLGSWGVENEAVLAGYENTRKYATDAKMLTVAVDTYKNAVNLRIEDEEARNNFEPSATESLGVSGTLLTDKEYEDYTATLTISGDSKYYMQEGYNKPDKIPDGGRSAAATFDKENTKNYMTTDNVTCGTKDIVDTDLRLHQAWQCAGFANFYVNQVAYKDYFTDASKTIVYGECNVSTNEEYLKSIGTCWLSPSGLDLVDGKKASEFFTGVTPGTFVRVQDAARSVIHSYIILGMDSTGVVIYDANWGVRCGIRLRHVDWDSFAAEGALSDYICCIIAPDNTKLPSGCTSNEFAGIGYILGKESE